MLETATIQADLGFVIWVEEEYTMATINYSDLRENLKTYLDRVYNDQETIIVARRDNENVVMLSIDKYNSLVETAHLLSTEANARHLAESIRQARAGHTTPHDLVVR
jgi:antitoxin YefM